MFVGVQHGETEGRFASDATQTNLERILRSLHQCSPARRALRRREVIVVRIFSRIAQACIVPTLIVSANPAFSNEPIPGVDAIIRKNLGGNLMVHTQTGGAGKFSAALAPGHHLIELNGPALARALLAVSNGAGPKGIAREIPVTVFLFSRIARPSSTKAAPARGDDPL